MRNDEQINISNQVMDKISAGKVKMKPRWKFLLEEASLDSGLLLLLISGAFVSSLLMYYWKINELYHLIRLGQDGVWHIALNFPYELIVITVLLLLLFNYLLKKNEWGYKRTWMLWFSFFLPMMFLCSVAVFALDFNEQLEQVAQKNNFPIIKPFYQQRMHNISNNTLKGKIVDIQNDEIKIDENDQAGNKEVILKKSELRMNDEKKMDIGDEVKIIGNRNKEKFKAWGLVKVKEKNEKKDPLNENNEREKEDSPKPKKDK